MLARSLLALSPVAIAACAASDPPPTPQAQAMRDADTVQSILVCTASFDSSTERHPAIVRLVDGTHVRVYRTGRYGTPKVRSPSSSRYATCSFAVVEWSTSRWLAYPACKLASGWTAFGSGHGAITWAKPSSRCGARPLVA